MRRINGCDLPPLLPKPPEVAGGFR